jgi:Flp pilus assembly protein CpaB
VLVAARDLPAGAVLRASDLGTAELAGDAGTMAALLPERELDHVLGRQLAAPVAQGAPLTRASVATSGSAPAAFTLVVPALRALGGSLHPGDRVTVLATFESGAGARARAVARGLRVLEVGRAPERFDTASASIPVTVALSDPSVAAALALANSEGKIDLLREGAKTRTAPIPTASARGGS